MCVCFVNINQQSIYWSGCRSRRPASNAVSPPIYTSLSTLSHNVTQMSPHILWQNRVLFFKFSTTDLVSESVPYLCCLRRLNDPRCRAWYGLTTWLRVFFIRFACLSGLQNVASTLYDHCKIKVLLPTQPSLFNLDDRAVYCMPSCNCTRVQPVVDASQSRVIIFFFWVKWVVRRII